MSTFDAALPSPEELQLEQLAASRRRLLHRCVVRNAREIARYPPQTTRK